MKQFLTVKEVADILGYEPRQIRRFIKLGAIQGSIVLNKESYRIPKKWVEDIIAKYPTAKEYKEAKKELAKEPAVELAPNPVKPNEPIVKPVENEVKENMPKKESSNTEITTTKPKAKAPKPFIPNPRKRAKKALKTAKNEPETESLEENELDNEPEDDVKDPLGDYKGIGNYD